MYECRHFFEDDCELLPTTLPSANELLINAHEVYPHSLSFKFYSFEHVGHPLHPKSFIDEKTVSIVKPGQERVGAGPDTDLWTEGLSAAELLIQFGIDPDVRVTPDGKLMTPERDFFYNTKSLIPVIPLHVPKVEVLLGMRAPIRAGANTLQ